MVQCFKCTCNEAACLGLIMGAGELGKNRLESYWLNTHIAERLERQAQEEAEGVGCEMGRETFDGIDRSVLV